MKKTFVFILLLFIYSLCLSSAAAINIQLIFIQIDANGDATITMTYQLEPIEYAGIATKKITPEISIERFLESNLNRDVEVLCNDIGVIKVKILQYARVEGGRYFTPEINLASMILSVTSSPQVTYNIFPDVTTVFPDGYSVYFAKTAVIQQMSYTSPGKLYTPPQPPYIQCLQEKTLPLSGIIPESATPAVAVLTGAVAGAAGLASGASGLTSWFSRLIDFLKGLLGTETTEKIGDGIKEQRSSTYTATGTGTILGFSPSELGVVVLGALAFGLAFFFADRNPPLWTPILIFILVGGLTTILHEVAHWAVARKYQWNTEIQFWGFGTIVMFLTAWLFGNVFAQPTLTIAHTEDSVDIRQNGLVMLSGPVISFFLAIACILLVSLGGLYATAGTIGFSMNLLTCVYSLLPIKPLDGEGIFKWSRALWAALFFPMIVIYIVINMI